MTRLIAPLFGRRTDDGAELAVYLTDVDMDGSLQDVWPVLNQALDGRYVARDRLLGHVVIEDGTVVDAGIRVPYRAADYDAAIAELREHTTE